jgi:hypothetical protein
LLFLTGLLVYKNDRFMEALEGPKENVKRMYASIQEDGCHDGLIQMGGSPSRSATSPASRWPSNRHSKAAGETEDAGCETPLTDILASAASSFNDLSFSRRMFLDFVEATPGRERS